MSRWETLSRRLCVWCAVAAGLCLTGIVTVTVLNIVFRRTGILPPITGAQESTEFFGALAVALALPFTQLRKANISVEMLHSYMSPRVRTWVERVNATIAAALCLVVAWRCVVYALDLRAAKEVSMTLAIPFWPINMVIGACFVLLALVFVLDAVKPDRAHAPPPEASV